MYKKVIQRLLLAGAAFTFMPSDMYAMPEETSQQKGAQQNFANELQRLNEQKEKHTISQEQFDIKFNELLEEHKKELPGL
ncbi:MAG: hypothetical protein K2Y08_00945 [Alphaproteobacteria bacterium]|nr:hypothetical protein [Alphaproteobacteria bacterium]